MSLEIDFDLGSVMSRFRIKDGWDLAGQEGEYFGNVTINARGWVVVLFDVEEDPRLYKSDALLIEERIWKPLK